ncbi:C6 transcription factor [Penicillium paradoxum]|uniref:C6 transcription factor n=1 Tax=Penicillium paradoxum TaxID=176176 RepID=UPI002549AAA5|nr:C6 transcription factor [Penicillium paradoxum]KAJ5787788.1 C6 transcription factor [Penicillium paradoxum]
MSGNPNDHDPSRQGDPNRQDPRDTRGPQWNTPDDQAPYPYPPTSYPPPDQDRGYQYPPPAQYAPSQYPPPPQYPPSQYPPAQYPDPRYSHPPAMNAIHGAQDPYRLPPPPGPYRTDAYGPQAAQGPYQAAAPRQRTAIACRYCRRRKIRCSGFETSADGRCSNCVRFNQDCMFTPVSSQTQAFVPAHTAYPHLRPGQNGPGPGRGGPPVLYGAHGQPLPPQQQPQGPETTLPPPQGMYYQNGRPPMDGAPPPLASTMPDPVRTPLPLRQETKGKREPELIFLRRDIAAARTRDLNSYHAEPLLIPPPPAHDRRTSPPSAYSYDARPSSSPHGSPFPPMQSHQAPMTPHQGSVPPVSVQPGTTQPKPSGTPQPGGVTPPPTSTPGGSQRGGLNVRDMLNPGDSQGRSSTDSDMLNALNRRGPQ